MERGKGIQERLIDAQILWSTGRKEGAFLLGLVALAGVSRIRYPIGTSPKIYFDKMREYHPRQRHDIDAKERSRKLKKPLYDSEAFKCMLLDMIGEIMLPNPKPGIVPPKYNIMIPFGPDGKFTNIEDIFYLALRNTFVHQGKFTMDAFLTERTSEGDILRIGHPTGIPENWIVNLIVAISKCAELT